MHVAPLRIAFSTLAFPDATLAEATALGRSWRYAGVELRLIDGQLIDSSKDWQSALLCRPSLNKQTSRIRNWRLRPRHLNS